VHGAAPGKNSNFKEEKIPKKCQPSIYIIKLFSCIYVCMLAKADSYQTAGTNWMTFFKGTHGNPGGNKG